MGADLESTSDSHVNHVPAFIGVSDTLLSRSRPCTVDVLWSGPEEPMVNSDEPSMVISQPSYGDAVGVLPSRSGDLVPPLSPSSVSHGTPSLSPRPPDTELPNDVADVETMSLALVSSSASDGGGWPIVTTQKHTFMSSIGESWRGLSRAAGANVVAGPIGQPTGQPTHSQASSIAAPPHVGTEPQGPLPASIPFQLEAGGTDSFVDYNVLKRGFVKPSQRTP